MYLVEFQHGLMRHDQADRVEHGIDGPVAAGDGVFFLAVDHEIDFCRLRTIGAGHDPQALEGDPLTFGGELLVDECDDVVIEDMLLAVGKVLEALEGVVQRLALDEIAHRFKLVAEGIAA